MRAHNPIRSTLLTLSVAALMASCGLLPTRGKPTGGDRGWIDWDGRGGWTGHDSGSGDRSASRAEGEAPAPGVALVEPMVGVAPLEAAEFAPAKSSDMVHRSNQNSTLRAGSVDDNAQWDDYLLYRLRFADWGVHVHDIDVSERHTIQVHDPSGRPVLSASVTVLDPQGHELAAMQTYADGRARFFPRASDDPEAERYQVRVEKAGAETTITIDRQTREHTVTLDARPASDPVRLDVHFLIDATGSMSDEIQQLKDNMIAISERIHRLPTNPDVRFGMTIYRDRGDVFVSRTFDFTPDVESFTAELREVVADGGGDYAESLNEGLHNAIHQPEWRLDETVSLIFLVADAPPHLDYQGDEDYAEEVFVAAQRGIKIFPIASSGLDDQGEYIFRQLAQITSGKFLFLTYGANGGPGDETTHHVDDYSVLSLDELVVRLVEEELAHLSGLQ